MKENLEEDTIQSLNSSEKGRRFRDTMDKILFVKTKKDSDKTTKTTGKRFHNTFSSPHEENKKRGEDAKLALSKKTSPFGDAGSLGINSVSQQSKSKKTVGEVKQKVEYKGPKRAEAINEPLIEVPEDYRTPALPLDKQLLLMDTIINKTLKDVSVQDWYDICWSEGCGTDKSDFFGPWLLDSGKMDVRVGDWQLAEEGEHFVGEWDKECYSQKREVTFRFERTTHLYTGPPIANVKQTHYCRIEGNDRCVISIVVEMDGIPFADSFNVQIRWVSTRVGEKDLTIKAGLFVNFIKHVLVAGKIRSGTTEETTKSQLDLLERVLTACGRQAIERQEVKELREQDQPKTNLSSNKIQIRSACFPFLDPQDGDDDIDREMSKIRDKIRIIKGLPLPEEKEEYPDFVLSQFKIILKALDALLVRKMGRRWRASMRQTMKCIAQQKIEKNHPLGGKIKKAFGFLSSGLEESLVAEPLRKRELSLPNKAMESMKVILNKTIADVSPADFYQVCFSENKVPFYRPWLNKTGRTAVQVGPWVLPEGKRKYTIEVWNNVSFGRVRFVSFRFKRSAALSLGPSCVSVKQTQYCYSGEDACVVATTTETVQAPFCNSYTVHSLWTATPTPNLHLSVKAGFSVVFHRENALESIIRDAVEQEVTMLATDFFREVRAAFISEDEQRIGCLRFVPGLFVEGDADISSGIQKIDQQSLAVEALLVHEPRDTDEYNFVLGQLIIVGAYLDNVIIWHKNQKSTNCFRILHPMRPKAVL